MLQSDNGAPKKQIGIGDALRIIGLCFLIFACVVAAGLEASLAPFYNGVIITPEETSAAVFWYGMLGYAIYALFPGIGLILIGSFYVR